MAAIGIESTQRLTQVSAALLLLRAASALAFFYHGSAIAFGVFTGPGPERFAASHHWPLALAYFVGLTQVAAATAILSGLLFRLGAAAICAMMLGAIFLVHLQHGFDVSNGGTEYALTQLLIAVAFLLTGPGRYSLGSHFPSTAALTIRRRLKLGGRLVEKSE